jgi:hypothetical protein
MMFASLMANQVDESHPQPTDGDAVASGARVAPRIRNQHNFDLFELMNGSRESTPDVDVLANAPETIKDKFGTKVWIVDKDKPDSIDLCRAAIKVCIEI